MLLIRSKAKYTKYTKYTTAHIKGKVYKEKPILYTGSVGHVTMLLYPMPIIRLKPNISDEQLIKLHTHYKRESEEQLEKAHKHPLWQEIKDYVNSIRPEILNQMKAKIVQNV